MVYLKTASRIYVLGGVPSPFDCYMVLRSLKTLSLRMTKHGSSGLAVAKFLETHPAVEKVLHPGLPSHPQHEVFSFRANRNWDYYTVEAYMKIAIFNIY